MVVCKIKSGTKEEEEEFYIYDFIIAAFFFIEFFPLFALLLYDNDNLCATLIRNNILRASICATDCYAEEFQFLRPYLVATVAGRPMHTNKLYYLYVHLYDEFIVFAIRWRPNDQNVT